jgi:uncharacterized protein YraI
MAVVAAPEHALAARPNGYPISNVNLRAGPDTDYPVIFTVPARAPISMRLDAFDLSRWILPRLLLPAS